MRSSSRIIRGQDAAELPNWSINLIGMGYENQVEKILSEINGRTLKNKPPTPPATQEELHFIAWEKQLLDREMALEKLERQTLEKAQEQGQKTGYEIGWNQAHNERVALIHATQTIENEFEQFKSQLSEKLLDLAVLVSKKVISDALVAHPKYVAELLNQILENMQLHSKSVSLRANPNTLRILEAQFGDQHMLGSFRMIEDPQQLEGGFLLQHPEGEVDATLQTRWLRAIETLGRNNPMNPTDLNNTPTKDPE